MDYEYTYLYKPNPAIHSWVSPIDILKISRFVPDLRDRENLAAAIRKTFDTLTKQTVDYTSIAEGMPQRRSLTFLKH